MNISQKLTAAVSGYAAGIAVYANTSTSFRGSSLALNALGILAASVALGDEGTIVVHGQVSALAGSAVGIGEWLIATDGELIAYTMAELEAAYTGDSVVVLGRALEDAADGALFAAFVSPFIFTGP